MVWILTGALFVHPYYRVVGSEYLEALQLPIWLMALVCTFEVGLGIVMLRRRQSGRVVLLQVGMVTAFTVILATMEPMLLVHPFGVLSKNVPFLAAVLAAYQASKEGFSPRVRWALRIGMALVWVTEGLLPKILYQQDVELAVVRNSGLVPMDEAQFLRLLGVLQAASGVAALALRGRPLRVLLWAQIAALIVLPLLVAYQMPLLWVHPFGPLIKNLPILVGTVVVVRRCT